jgi:hypothetical protein
VQVKKKLDSDEPIDYDYWEQLLRNLRIWKAKAKLRRVSQEIVKERLQALRKQQADAAFSVQEKLQEKLDGTASTTVAYDASFDPEPLLKLRAEDKALVQVNEKKFLEDIVSTTPWHPDLRHTDPARPMSGGGFRNLATSLHRTRPQTR